MKHFYDFVNLTPHAIAAGSGQYPHHYPSEGVCRVETTSGEVAAMAVAEFREGMDCDLSDRWPIKATPDYGKIVGLPDYDPNKYTMYIVSGIVAAAMRDKGIVRPDVVTPGTGPNDNPIRENGQVKAVTCFVFANYREKE
jgi:hypothetical protein